MSTSLLTTTYPGSSVLTTRMLVSSSFSPAFGPANAAFFCLRRVRQDSLPRMKRVHETENRRSFAFLC